MIANMINNFRAKRKAAQPEEEKEKKKLREEEEKKEELRRSSERNWKTFYQECCKMIDLNGYWTGGYGSHGNEYIEVTQKGYEVQGLKLTGISPLCACMCSV